MTNQITDADLKAALPDVESEQKLSGIVSEATIYRDKWGIPHIAADNESDLFLHKVLRQLRIDYFRWITTE